MKECEQKRNLAFYKRSGEPWTQEEYEDVCEYVGEEEGQIAASDSYERRYIFDNGDETLFLYPWASQEKSYNFKNCKQVAYEDIFNEDGTVKGEQMKEEVVTVKNKGELIDLLRSGGKWTSDEFFTPVLEYCIYDESHLNPFRFISEDGDNDPMIQAWSFKTWRKVKPQFERGDLVVCWDNDNDDDRNGLDVRVWNETGVFKTYKKEGNTVYDHYELYTGPVPKHIQDFIDEIKAKEKL